MRVNYFDNMILGANTNGQGSMIAVEGTHRQTLRVLIAKFARRLSLRLGSWRALSLKRIAAGLTPATATCPSYSGIRQQRHQRCMSGVVVDPGTVGVNW
jgi:hypothetical protein